MMRRLKTVKVSSNKIQKMMKTSTNQTMEPKMMMTKVTKEPVEKEELIRKNRQLQLSKKKSKSVVENQRKEELKSPRIRELARPTIWFKMTAAK